MAGAQEPHTATIRVLSECLTWVSHPGPASRTLRGRRSGPAAPSPLPSGPRPPRLPLPAAFPLPAPCPASPFLRPGPAPHGHKGTAAGQERRPGQIKVVGGGGGEPRRWFRFLSSPWHTTAPCHFGAKDSPRTDLSLRPGLFFWP